jgi:hypothetical protein
MITEETKDWVKPTSWGKTKNNVEVVWGARGGTVG